MKTHALAQQLQPLAHPTRLQIIAMVAGGDGWIYPAEVHARLGRLTQSTVAHHLRVLTGAGFVERRKVDGRIRLQVNAEVFAVVAGAVRAAAR
jgi:DNA-binding transcriptional ArsR family regulator